MITEYNHRNWDFVRKLAKKKPKNNQTKKTQYAPVMFRHHLLTGETTTYAMKQEAQPAHSWKNTFLKVP